MATKKVEKMLKGVAVTGASVAGASMFGDASLAYAAETGLEDTLVSQPEIVVDVETVLEDSQESSNGAGQIDVELSENDTAEGLTEQLEDYEEQLQMDEASFTANGYDHEGLEEQESFVNTKLEAEAAKRADIADDSKPDLGKNDYYKNYGRPLAVELVKYNLLQLGKIDANNIDALQYKWWEGTYEEKHLCVQYIGTDAQYHEEYYDYVTADAEGNSIYKVEGDKVNGISRENYAPDVAGINVVEKKAVFETEPSKTKKYEINYTDTEGNVTKMTGARYQRTDFESVNGTKKGVDWYKTIDYLKDVAERKRLAAEIEQLGKDVATTNAKLTLLANQAATTPTSTPTESPAQPAAQEETAQAAPQIDLSAITILSSATPQTVAAEIAGATAGEAPAPAPAVQAEQTVETPAAPADEVVPLAVVEDDVTETASTGGTASVEVEAGRVVDQTKIAEEEVARARMETIEKVGRQGLFYTIIAGIFAFFAIGKKKKDEEEEDVV